MNICHIQYRIYSDWHIIPTSAIPMGLNMCMVQSLIYATSVWLSLSHDPFLVLLPFPDLLVTVGSTAIPTSTFIFKCFYLS